jgi:alpha-glucosidase
MNASKRLIVLFALVCTIAMSRSMPADVAELTVSSPDGSIAATLMYEDKQGTLAYRVQSQGREIITASFIGITTDRGDFRSGMTFLDSSLKAIDDTYTMPQGKVSICRNHANEQALWFSKDGQKMSVLFRVYNDGVAFSFVFPGVGNIEIYEESSAITLAGENFTYWGQDHPNSYGYETALGPITGDRMSNPVLAHLKDRDHFVLMGQAATYGHYVQTHFERSGSTFRFSFPMDQAEIGPVRTTLPFHSPWRMVIISPNSPARIVESYLVENLNPPTDPALLNPDGTVKAWIKPGRVMWDFIAGDKDKPTLWIDAAAEMGWEYYMADAGFARQWGGDDAVRQATEYAASKNIGILGWAHSREFDTRAKAAATMSRYAGMDLKGVKIDFFDHNTLSDPPNRVTNDYEDTQRSLQIRDWIFELGIENKFLLELHGNTIPTGERRRYPNLMTLEGINGMEKRTPTVSNDLCIPYVRNVMGPASYTIIRFSKSPGSHAYQMAMSIVYEAGLMIYAEHGKTLLDWPGREMIKDVPSNWDEIRFIDGMPSDYVVIARRKGQDWFIGGMTSSHRTTNIALDFLSEGKTYEALMFRDDTHTSMHRETRTVNRKTSLSIDMLENGGFAIHLKPAASL